MTRDEMAAIAGTEVTISAKIRALHAAGCPRSEIAGFLKRSYQQVRQVLVLDEMRRARQPAEPVPSAGLSEREPHFDWSGFPARVEVERDGRVRLPAELGVAPGEVFLVRRIGGEIVLTDSATAIARLQEMARRLIPPGGPSLVDELIAERRREAERDDRE